MLSPYPRRRQNLLATIRQPGIAPNSIRRASRLPWVEASAPVGSQNLVEHIAIRSRIFFVHGFVVWALPVLAIKWCEANPGTERATHKTSRLRLGIK
jgi:hypothetical protein